MNGRSYASAAGTPVSPYIINPGSSAATINGIIAAGGWYKFRRGTHSLTGPLVVPSSTVLEGEPGAILLCDGGAGWPVASTANDDDPTNAMIKIQGVVGALVNTTIATLALSGAASIVLTSLSGVVAGQYLILEGRNTPTNSLPDSDGTGVILSEVVQVSATWNGASPVVLTRPTVNYHSTTVTVKDIVPPRSVRLIGLELNASGRRIAAGIDIAAAIDVEVEGLRGVGFSRALATARRGAVDWLIQDTKGLGENNAIILLDSALHGRVVGFDNLSDGLRQHAYGVPRGLISFRRRCKHVEIGNGSLLHGNIGIQCWGGQGISVHDVLIRDMVADEASTRGTTAGEITGDKFGVGVDGGAGPLDNAEYYTGCSFDNVVVEDVTVGSGTSRVAWYAHDGFSNVISGGGVLNRGIPSYRGLYLSDWGGEVNGFTVLGSTYAVWLHAACNVRMNDLKLDGSSQAGACEIGLYFGEFTGTAEVNGVKIDGFNSFVRFHASFNARLTTFVQDIYTNGGKRFIGRAVPMYNDTGVAFQVGEVVEWGGGTSDLLYVSTPTGASTRPGIVLSGGPYDTGTGLMLVMPLPATGITDMIASEEAVAIGEQLVTQNALRRVIADADSTATLTVIGYSMTAKAAGSAGSSGWIRVAPR